MNVVVFSGTTEGRELSRQLAALGIEVTVSVATPLGQEEQGSTPGVTVRCGRLLPDEMAALLGDAALCIDATHPYAVEATKNIKAAAEKAGVEYLRLLRPASPLPENCLVFESAKQAAEALFSMTQSGFTLQKREIFCWPPGPRSWRSLRPSRPSGSTPASCPRWKASRPARRRTSPTATSSPCRVPSALPSIRP